MKKKEGLDKQWKEILERNPDRNQLRYIIARDKLLRVEAANKLLEKDPTNNDLIYIMSWVESMIERVWKIFLAREPLDLEIQYAGSQVSLLRELALKEEKRRLCKKLVEEDTWKKIKPSDLLCVSENCESLLGKVWKRYLEEQRYSVTDYELLEIIKKIPALKEEASERFIQQFLGNREGGSQYYKHILFLTKDVDFLGEQAIKKILEKNPTEYELLFIMDHFESLRKKAKKILKEKKERKVFELQRLNPIDPNDSRGPTYEWMIGGREQLTILVRKKGSVLGGHFHKGEDSSKNPEKFFLAKGKLKSVFQPVEAEKVEKLIEAGSIITIYPYVTHTLKVLEDSVLIEYRDNHFNKKNPDTYQY